jgi:hypothetical protein
MFVLIICWFTYKILRETSGKKKKNSNVIDKL